MCHSISMLKLCDLQRTTFFWPHDAIMLSKRTVSYHVHIYALAETHKDAEQKLQRGAFDILLPIFLLHKLKVALKSLWSFCNLVATSNINNELKEWAPHWLSSSPQKCFSIQKESKLTKKRIFLT